MPPSSRHTNDTCPCRLLTVKKMWCLRVKIDLTSLAQFSRKAARKAMVGKWENGKVRKSESDSHFLIFSLSLPHPPPTKCTTSILSASLTMVCGQSVLRTTELFSSIAIRCLGSEKYSSRRSRSIAVGTDRFSPFRNIWISDIISIFSLRSEYFKFELWTFGL